MGPARGGKPQPRWDTQLMRWEAIMGPCEKRRDIGQDLDAAESDYANRRGAAAARFA